MRRLFILVSLLTAIAGLSAVMAQQVHIVQRGENLSSIARQYGRTIQEVAQANGISAPYIIHKGNRLVIPAPGAAPAQTQPQPTNAQPAAKVPTNIDNCCFVDRQCITDEEWRVGWHAFRNGSCAAPAQPQPQSHPQTQTSAKSVDASLVDIDNCCHLDRECHTEAEWSAGWTAFKALECWDEYHRWARTPDPRQLPASGSNNCCSAPGWTCLNEGHFAAGHAAFRDYGFCPLRIRNTYIPDYTLYDAIDNCCHLGRECQSAEDWARGHSDKRFFRCEISVPVVHDLPVSILGPQRFVDQMRAAFSLLKAHSPWFYDYAIRELNVIRAYSDSDNDPTTSGCHVACASGTVFCVHEDTYHYDFRGHQAIAGTASVIVHEACHCHRDAKGYPYGNSFWETELPCHKAQADLMKELDPDNSFGIPWENYHAVALEHGVTDLRY